jgi:hypothetical protein
MKRFAAAACAAVVLAMISPCVAATPEPSLVTPMTYDNHKGYDFLFGTWTTLRLYDPATHQWSLYWGTTKIGLALP